MVARTVRNSPGDAALRGSWNSVWPSGSCTGTARTSWPFSGTSVSVPAATTPLSRIMRASASHGRSPTVACPEWPTFGEAETSVASVSENRPTIWLPAVLDRPSVATRAATPTTVPRTVRRALPGRASRLARHSPKRSLGLMRGLMRGAVGSGDRFIALPRRSGSLAWEASRPASRAARRPQCGPAGAPGWRRGRRG